MKYVIRITLVSIVALLSVSCLNNPDPPDPRDQLILTLNLANVNGEIATETDTISISQLRFLVGTTLIHDGSGDTLLVNQNAVQITHPSQNPDEELIRLISGTFSSPVIYNALDFEIKQAEPLDLANGGIDDAFVDGTSGNERYSMIIEGTYNGESFEFKSTRNFNFEFDIDDQSGGTPGNLLYNLNMQTDLSTWFQNPSSGSPDLVNPADTTNSEAINNNIEAAIQLN